jgi:hypothetical protein
VCQSFVTPRAAIFAPPYSGFSAATLAIGSSTDPQSGLYRRNAPQAGPEKAFQIYLRYSSFFGHLFVISILTVDL